MKAIKGLSILMLFYAFVLETKANPVDVRTAQNVAVKFMNANAKTPLRSMDDLHLVTTYNINRGDAAFYVFNTSNGFVIVSADDCATPILGYSDEGQFDTENIPIQMQDYLQGFVEQIQYGIENHLDADEQTDRQWELVRTVGRLTDNRSNRTVEPLITAMWDQGCYYNEKCPEDMSGMCGHAVTGCVATAMAQIMHYWGYPEHGIGFNSYTPLDPYTYLPSDYPEQSVDFGATTYDWDNMPNQLDGSNTYEQIEAVATLMWHCGVSVDMMYSSYESGAYSYRVEYALEDYFSYSDELRYEYKSEFSDASWKAKLKDCLNLGRPVYYAGYGSSLFGDSGHAFVCDGYDIDEMFHFNWGWSGEGNGYFAIGALNVLCYEFNNDNTAIFNIHPQGETTNYVINATVNNDEGGTVSGGGTFAHGENVTLSAMANNGYGFCYWEENGGIVSTDPNYSFTANYNRDLVAVFAGPFAVTVSAEEGGMATGGGSYFYGESCLVIASANEGYAFSFWTDNDEVVSYEANYIFPVTSETHLIAHFVSLEGNIIFADGNVKAICIANWDTNGDGMLSYTEAASVISLGEVFRGKSNIYSFKELQYFINLTSINNYAFYCCSGLTSLIIPNAVTSVGNSAFQYCSNLTGSLIIPNSVISIGDNAFNNCSGLTSLTIGNSVSLISNSAFYYCNGLTSLIVLAETPPTLGTDAFRNVSTDIPVFVPCVSVEAYQATEGWSAFPNIMGMCSSGTVTVAAAPSEGGTVTGGGYFGGGAVCTVNAIPNEGFGFAFWTENGNIVSHDANYSFVVTEDSQLVAHFIQEENIVFTDANVKNICVSKWDTNGDGELSTAEAAAVRSLGSVFRNNTTISSFEELQYFIGLTSIGSYAFQNCSGLSSLTFPSSMTTIGNSAFSGCTGLVSLTLPNSVVSIESGAFSGCTGLVSLTLPNSISTIGSYAFQNCTGLASLTLSNSVVRISSSAFLGCSGLNVVYFMGNIHQWCNIQFSGYASNPLRFAHNLFIDNELVTDLVIPETVSEIKNYAFSGATCLTSLTISNSVTSIGASAFSGCTGLSGSLVIPNSVTTIGSSAFSGCTGLASLILSNSLVEIGGSAFSGCTGFTGGLVIPNSVTSIGSYAFQNCSGFTGDLAIPNSVTSIGSYAFQNCSGFTGNLTIPNSVTSIGEYAFQNCSGFTGNLAISNSVTIINMGTFSGCNGFTGDLVIPNSVITIEGSSYEYGGYGAFYGCSGFDGNLSIPESVTTIGNGAFSGCSGFTGDLIIPNSVTTIGERAFNGCRGFSGSLVISNSVISIGDYAFDGCRGLTSLTIGNSVTSIGDYAFFDCYGLTSLTIGSSVALIGYIAFYSCYHLESITVFAETPPIVQRSFLHCPFSIPVYVPCGSVEAYQFADYWSEFYNIQEGRYDITVSANTEEGGSVSGTGNYCLGSTCTITATASNGYNFQYWTKNDSVVSDMQTYSFIVSESANYVAHFEAVVVENIVFADANVKAICVANWDTNGDGELSYAEAAAVTSLGEVFRGNTEITSFEELQFFTGLRSISNNAFRECNGLTGSLILPDEITSIGSYAFYNCSGLRGTLIIPNFVVTIGSYAFGNCNHLASLSIGNSVTSIADRAFWNCSSLVGPLTLSNSVTAIGFGAFSGCSGLTGSLTLPNSVTTIGFGAFSGCSGLTGTLTIPNSITSLGNTAFYGCSGLNSIIVLRVRPLSLGSSVFYQVSTNIPVYVPCESVESYQSAAGWNSFSNIIGLCSSGTISVTADPIEGGEVSGAGTYASGTYCIVTATPNEGYSFANWTENGCIVSYDFNYNFIVTGESVLTAHFVPEGNISFADASVKAICVTNWDTNGDGELSYAEAASVMSLREVFRGNSEITSFDELQFFIGLNSISENAFMLCSGLTRLPVFSPSITSIGKYAFFGCTGMVGELTIPNTVVSIGYGAFGSCSGFTGSLTIPNSVTSIGDAAFHSCTGLTGSLIIPNSVTSIGNYAFCSCYYLKGDLIIPNSVTIIGHSAFSFCYGLSGTLTIPSSVSFIDERAFYACRSLKSIIALSDVPPVLGSDAFFHVSTTIPIYVPCESVEAYQSAVGWNAFSNIVCISSGTISVEADPFEGGEVSGAGMYEGGTFCTVTATPNEGYSFINWTENGSVVSYDSIYSFIVTGESVLTAHFASEENIVFADSNVKTICVANWDTNGDGELSYLEAASVVTLGEVFSGNTEITSFEELQYFICLHSISDSAFYNCSGLTGSLIIPKSVTSIGSYAFYNCYGLTGSLSIPNSVTSVGSYAFYNCYGLTGSIILPDEITSISDYAFYNCNGLTGSLIIPNNVTYIGTCAFYNCRNLGSLTLPNHLTVIGYHAFCSCSGLTGELFIPNSVTYIYDYAFDNCSGLASLVIGNSVVFIGNSAFYACSGLISITSFRETPPEMGSDVFSYVSTTIPLYVPCESVEAYQLASGWNVFSNINCISSGTITVAADPIEGGEVTGAGTYEGGACCTVTATPNEGYYFAVWTKNGNVVSYDPNYSFVVTGDCVLTAHFVTEGNIVFADANAKAICVSNWDTNGDGELSYIEAASVKSFVAVFWYNTEITSFDELQYFIGLPSVGAYAFHGCSGLTRLPVFPVFVRSIDYMAFAECTSLSGSLTIPNSVTTIGEAAFHDCSGFTGNLVIPNSVTTIGEGAFYGCSGFTGSLTIPNSMTTIDDHVFNRCSGFTGTLTIPSSITSIGDASFFNCSSLIKMIVLAETPPTVGSSAFYNVPTNIPVYVPCESVEAYQSSEGWNAFLNIMCISSGTITVVADPLAGGEVSGGGMYEGGAFCTVTATPNEGYCFANWTENGHIVSSDSNYSFVVTGESVLTAHFVPDGNIVFADANVKAICVTYWDTNGDGELSYAEAAAVTSLGEVFSENTEITSFEELQYFIGLTSINHYAFFNCSGLTGELIIPNSVTTIGQNAFYGCSGLTGNLTIPNSVTAIDSWAFLYCSGFTGDLTIGNSVTTIGYMAFGNCSGFTGNLTLGNSIISIDSHAFSNCSGFTGDLTIPNSVTWIGDGAFYNCSGFTGSLTIFNSMTSIDTYAFQNCIGLTSMIVLAETPPVVGSNTFYNVPTYIPVYVPCEALETYQTAEGWNVFSNIICICSSGTISVAADPVEGGELSGAGTYEGGTICTVTAVPNQGYHFANWTKDGIVVSFDANYSFVVASDNLLTAHFVMEGNIVFADSNVKAICVSNWDTNGDGELSYAEAAAVTSLGEVFRGNTEITSFEELQYFISLSTIGNYAFYNCSSLTGSLIIPNAVTSLGDYAFYNCSGLTGSLTIPNTVTSLGKYVFYNCIGLTRSVTISNSVTIIGNGVFQNCSGLNAVYYMGDINQWCNIQFGYSTSNPLCYAHNLYIDNDLVTDLVIPETVGEILDYAFYGATCLTSLTIPNSVTSIGEWAFYGCSNLTGNLIIPNSVTAIGDFAFEGCSGFTGNLVIPNSMTTINYASFAGCSGFTGNLIISNSVTLIEGCAFRNCSGLTGSLIIPDSVTSIGWSAFGNCSGFSGSLIIPNSVTTINDNAFFGCNGLSGDLFIPDPVTSIGNNAFSGCRNLSEAILFGTTPPILGSNAFANSTFPIYVPYESLNDYKTAENWSSYQSRIFPMTYTTISGYNEGGGWSFIASPLTEDKIPTTVDNMLSGTNYDLYRFNQSATDEEWQNYKADSFNLVNGKGYAYANEAKVNVIFKGTFNEDETKVINLEYDAEIANAGWNLVGNPFPVSAYIDRPYYVMNDDGTAINPVAVPASTPIPPCTSVMVKAEGIGESVTFSKTAPVMKY